MSLSETSDEQQEHHTGLHRQIYLSSRLADWIYHDVRLDCDGGSLQRTNERLGTIRAQHGTDAIFGIMGAWAEKACYRVNKAMARRGIKMSPLQAIISDDLDSTTLSIQERGYMSAIQFVKAVSNDDLEMAEAIYSAAANSSDDDLLALALSALNIDLTLSNQAVILEQGSTE